MRGLWQVIEDLGFSGNSLGIVYIAREIERLKKSGDDIDPGISHNPDVLRKQLLADGKGWQVSEVHDGAELHFLKL